MRNLLLTAALVLGTGGGCYMEESGPVYGGGAAYVSAGPQLAYVSPGVEVVADYDYPVFYSSGLYYRYYGGYWYSSRWHDRGWGVSRGGVPVGIRGISRPNMYAHYHAGGGYIRDHRAYGAPAYRGGAAVRTPAYRAPARTYRPATPTRHK